MIKREYIVKNDKLCYVDNDPAFPSKEVECTKEELTALIIKQDKHRAELSDDYIEKVANAMKEASSVTVDYRYEVAKSVLSSSLPDFRLKPDYYGKFSYLPSKMIEHTVKQAYLIADEFTKQGEYNEKT